MPQTPKLALRPQTMFGVHLDWRTCPDGVELVDLPRLPAKQGRSFIDQGAPFGPHFRFRSDARADVGFSIETLEDLMILRFVNSKTEEEKVGFLSRFGMLVADWDVAAQELEHKRGEALHALLVVTAAAGRGARKAAEALVNLNLERIQLTSRMIFATTGGSRMMLQPKSLWHFMYLEIALAAAHGTRLQFCQTCGDAFLTGPLTARRSKAVFCNDKCRVRHFRSLGTQTTKRKAKKEA